LQKRAGRFGRSANVIRRHISPVSRPGVARMTLPPAWAIASGAMVLSDE
jgi:hypothetical protein